MEGVQLSNIPSCVAALPRVLCPGVSLGVEKVVGGSSPYHRAGVVVARGECMRLCVH